MRVTVNKIGTGATPEDSIRPDLSGYNVQSYTIVSEHGNKYEVELDDATDFEALLADITSVDLDGAANLAQLKAAIKTKFQKIEAALKARWGIHGG